VTLPLITLAPLAGLILSYTRHMASLPAIIFLMSARWRIATASILSAWEQGGISVVAAYSTAIILSVLIAIGVLYFVPTGCSASGANRRDCHQDCIHVLS